MIEQQQLYTRASALKAPLGAYGVDGVWASWLYDLRPGAPPHLRRYARVRVQSVVNLVDAGKPVNVAIQEVVDSTWQCPCCSTPWSQVMRSQMQCPDCTDLPS